MGLSRRYDLTPRSRGNCDQSTVNDFFQAPVHTDSLTVYKTSLKTIKTEEGELKKPVVTAESVVEQRVSHFLMGLAIIGTMTGPLLIVLHTMPRALFAGVFFVVGVSPAHALFFSRPSFSSLRAWLTNL